MLVLISHCAFSLCAIFNPNQNKLIAMIIMINITIIGTYPLKQLISRKLEMNVDNELNFHMSFQQILIKSFFNLNFKHYFIAPYFLLEHFKIAFNKRFCNI